MAAEGKAGWGHPAYMGRKGMVAGGVPSPRMDREATDYDPQRRAQRLRSPFFGGLRRRF